MSIEDAIDQGMAIQGWKTREELAWLAGHASRAKFVLDVGCWRGQTTKVMAAVCRGTIIAVDHVWGTYSGEWGRNEILKTESSWDIIQNFQANLEAEMHEARVFGIFENGPAAREAVRSLAGKARFDFAWLDGDHAYEDVRADLLAYRPLMAMGGILAGHDYDPSFPGVIQAVDELCQGFKRGPHTAWYLEVQRCAS